jgi:hypothetical protein
MRIMRIMRIMRSPDPADLLAMAHKDSKLAVLPELAASPQKRPIGYPRLALLV